MFIRIVMQQKYTILWNRSYIIVIFPCVINEFKITSLSVTLKEIITHERHQNRSLYKYAANDSCA